MPTPSHREQIMQRILTVLTALNIAGATVERTRTIPKARDEGPGIILTWKNDAPTFMSVTPAPVQRKLEIEIKIVVRGAVPDSVADPFYIAVYAGMLSDVSLNNLAQDVRPGTDELESIDADDDAAILTMPFIIDYRTTSYPDSTS